MGQDYTLIQGGKHKPPKNVHKKANPSHVASWQQAIGTSNNFVNDVPREVRHHNAADLPRELYRRWILFVTGTFLAQYVFDVQAEMNLRTRLYSHRDSPIFSEPTSNQGADTTVATSRPPTRPSANATRVQGYGNIAGRNMTFASPLGPAQTELEQPASWYEQAANALSWLNPFAFDESSDSDYHPSGWPFQGGDAAPDRPRHKVTRRPENHHVGHHHRSNGTAAAPQPLLYRILSNIISRRELGEFLMRINGLDPNALYKHRFTPANHATMEESKPGIDLYIDSQKKEWLVVNKYDEKIERLPDLDDLFSNLIDSVKAQAKHNITRELTETAHHQFKFPALRPRNNKTSEPFPKLTGGGTYTLKSIKFAQLLTDNVETEASSIGYVVDVEDYVLDRTESYVIAPAHYPALIQISTNEEEQVEWLKRNHKLFFNAKLQAPQGRRTIIMEEIERYADFPGLFDDVAGYLSENIVNAFKGEAFGETRREKMVNHLQWHVPFYAAWIAYKRHEYTEAVVRGILDVISIAGGPFSKALKAVGIVARSGRLVNIAKQAQKIGYLDVPAQVDGLTKKGAGAAAGKIGGPAGRVFSDYLLDEVNQSPERNTLNQLVDEAVRSRGENQRQIESVARNT